MYFQLIVLTIPLFVAPLVATFTTLVKDRHRLVSTSYLHLQEIGLCVATFKIGTNSHGPINIFPRCSSAQDIVYLFASFYDFLGEICINTTTIGASGTYENGSTRSRASDYLYLKQCSIQWAKPHFDLLMLYHKQKVKG